MRQYLRYSVFILTCVLFAGSVKAQVGINNPNPDPVSILDLKSNSKGLLIPRMSALERLAITDPPESLLVYDTDNRMFYYWDPSFGDFNWLALNPFNFRDGATFRTHPLMNDMNIFESSGGDKGDAANSPRVWIDGQLIVGSFERPGAKGIMVEGDSKFKGTVTFDKNPVFTEGLPAPSGNIGTIVDNSPAAPTYNTTFQGYGTVPKGGIIMWSGSLDALPPGWALCDGETTYDDELGVERTTPDLKDRFIISAGGFRTESFEILGVPFSFQTGYDVDSVGGVSDNTLTNDNMPSHSHSINHGHGINDPGHDHNINGKNGGGGDRINMDNDSGNEFQRTADSQTGITINDFNGSSGSTGELNPDAIDNRPPFYALAFIIRVQ